MAERVGFEEKGLLKTKQVPLESIAHSAKILNFRAALAQNLAQN